MIKETKETKETDDETYLKNVVKPLLEKPDDLRILRTLDSMGVLLSLECAKEDVGKIIGKEGQTAKALRTLLRILGAKINARLNLKVNLKE